MEIFVVSLFGHREINDFKLLEERLTPIVKEMLKNKPYVSFMIGRNGEFDEFVASVIKGAQKISGQRNSDITLVLPYTVSDIKYYEEYYDNIIIPENVCKAHPKMAIALRNRWMIEHSDLVIFYVEREVGGAYMAMKYAEKMEKQIINLCVT